MLSLLLAVGAFATPVDRFPWQIEATYEGEPQVVAIAVPPELRSFSDPADGSDLLVLDEAGEELPVVAVRSVPPQTVPLRLRGGRDPYLWTTRPLDRPIDGLELRMGSGGWAATATVERLEAGEWVPHASKLLFEHLQGQDRRLYFDPTGDSLRVRVHQHYPAHDRVPSIKGLRDPTPVTMDSELRLAVTSPHVREDGWAEYSVDLPHDLPLRAVTLHTDEPLFDRAVRVRSTPLGDWTATGGTKVRRLSLGGAQVDMTRVTVSSMRTDRLLLYVEAHGEAPLELTEVTVELEDRALLLLDPGPGPLTVLGGAPAGTRRPGDLEVAERELLRMEPAVAEVSTVADNPRFMPEEVRTGVALPGGELIPGEWGYARTIEGSGLVHIALPPEVIALARPDRGDLRVVDEDNRQVPFASRTRPTHRPHTPAWTRSEEGGVSRLEIESSGRVETLTLRTEAPLFERDITLYRRRGAALEPLRSHRWRGEDHPATLTLRVSSEADSGLVVQIDNRDNPPLSITDVELGLPDHALVAVVPEGSRLLYGQPRASAPRYDLALIESDLVHRARVGAELGPQQILTPPPASRLQQGALFGGIAVMVLALGGMTAQLLRDEDETEGETEG